MGEFVYSAESQPGTNVSGESTVGLTGSHKSVSEESVLTSEASDKIFMAGSSYIEWQSLNGSMPSDDTLTKQLVESCTRLFRKKKFFLNEEELNFGTGISKYFLKRHNIKDVGSQQRSWWEKARKIVRKKIDNKRTNVQSAVKEEFMSKRCRCCVGFVVVLH